MLRRLAAFVVFSFAVSCGGSTTPAESPPSEPEEPAGDANESAPDEAEKASPEAEAAADATSGSAEASATDGQREPREVKYIVTPEGLEVEVAGVRFMTAAKAIQLGGGWGVRVSATAKSKDGKAHSLLSPKGGPIALAGSVKRGGQTERFDDKRDGDDEKTIESGAPLELSREWPAKGEKPLRAGDELELEVGLWGLGDDAANRRPVRGFFRVKLIVGKKKPQAVVTPPPTTE